MRRPDVAARGFTMVELIVVMILVGVVAAVAAPRLMSGNFLTAASLRDQVQAGLRSAQKSAVAKRRVVCAVRGTPAWARTYTIAREPGASNCTLPMAGAVDVSGLDSAALAPAADTLPAVLYFQPTGRITSDIAGLTPVIGTLAFTYENATYTIRVDGVSGYVE